MRKNKIKDKILIYKAWFDKGFALTNYAKYALAALGFASQKYTFIIFISFIYGVICFILGYCFYKFGWVEREQEISNKYNLFVREVRKDLNKRKTNVSYGRSTSNLSNRCK